MSANAAPQPTETTRRRRRVTGTAVAVGAAGSLALALSMGASLSGYAASIVNTDNTAASAALAVAETSGTFTCNSYDSTASCSSINKYGGTATPLKPGGTPLTTTVRFTNTGSVAVGSATLKAGPCTATTTGVIGSTTPSTTDATANLCSMLNVKVYKAATASGTPVFDGTPAAFAAATTPTPIDLATTLATGAGQDFTFVVSLPQAATTAVQGQKVAQQITWAFTQ